MAAEIGVFGLLAFLLFAGRLLIATFTSGGALFGSGADAFGVAIARFFRPFSMDTLAWAAYAVVGDRPGIGRHSPS